MTRWRVSFPKGQLSGEWRRIADTVPRETLARRATSDWVGNSVLVFSCVKAGFLASSATHASPGTEARGRRIYFHVKINYFHVKINSRVKIFLPFRFDSLWIAPNGARTLPSGQTHLAIW